MKEDIAAGLVCEPDNAGDQNGVLPVKRQRCDNAKAASGAAHAKPTLNVRLAVIMIVSQSGSCQPAWIKVSRLMLILLSSMLDMKIRSLLSADRDGFVTPRIHLYAGKSPPFRAGRLSPSKFEREAAENRKTRRSVTQHGLVRLVENIFASDIKGYARPDVVAELCDDQSSLSCNIFGWL